MLGLKLNHVSKRGHWAQPDKILWQVKSHIHYTTGIALRASDNIIHITKYISSEIQHIHFVDILHTRKWNVCKHWWTICVCGVHHWLLPIDGVILSYDLSKLACKVVFPASRHFGLKPVFRFETVQLEPCERTLYFIPHFIMDVITYRRLSKLTAVWLSLVDGGAGTFPRSQIKNILETQFQTLRSL